MTEREREILDIIRDNPMISQEALAQRLGITRGTAGVHVAHLTHKGLIRGRGYVLREEPNVVIIGGANGDLRGRSFGPPVNGDSNPGIVEESPGGVGRNIGENLARLGVETKIIAPLGKDARGQWLREEGEKVGLNFSYAPEFVEGRTPSYMEILDQNGELALAINDMELMDRLTPEILAQRDRILALADIVVIDANIPEETLEYVVERKKKIVADGVSSVKVLRLQRFLKDFTLLKVNRKEGESLLAQSLDKEEDIKKGVLRLGKHCPIVLTLGAQGVAAWDGKKYYRLPGTKVDTVSVTGAGDAFTAGLVYSMLQGEGMEEMLATAFACSLITLESPGANSSLLNEKTLEKKRKELS